MGEYDEIDPCLVTAFLAALPDAVNATKYENGPVFDPMGKDIWFELTSLQNPSDAKELGTGGSDEITGVLQVDIFTPLNTSTAAANLAVKNLNLFFAIGKPISYNSTVLKITRCGKSGASGEDQGYYKTIVSIFWKTRINRNH